MNDITIDSVDYSVGEYSVTLDLNNTESLVDRMRPLQEVYNQMMASDLVHGQSTVLVNNQGATSIDASNYWVNPQMLTPDEVINLNNSQVIVGEGIREQTNNVNTTHYSTLTAEEFQERITQLTNQSGDREFIIPQMDEVTARLFDQAMQREAQRMLNNSPGLPTAQRISRRNQSNVSYRYGTMDFGGDMLPLVIRETKEAPEGYKWDDEGRLEKL